MDVIRSLTGFFHLIRVFKVKEHCLLYRQPCQSILINMVILVRRLGGRNNLQISGDKSKMQNTINKKQGRRRQTTNDKRPTTNDLRHLKIFVRAGTKYLFGAAG